MSVTFKMPRGLAGKSLDKNTVPAQVAMLALSCALAAFALGELSAYLKPLIEQNRLNKNIATLNELVPNASIDESLFNNASEIELDGSAYQIMTLRDPAGIPLYYILSGSEPGYSGDIRFMVAVDVEGIIKNVRVMSHTETPGLGDKIELAKSDWILSFNSLSLLNTPIWGVEKDGGTFEQFTGATITPRAVVRGVHRALLAHSLIKQTQEKEALDE